MVKTQEQIDFEFKALLSELRFIESYQAFLKAHKIPPKELRRKRKHKPRKH